MVLCIVSMNATPPSTKNSVWIIEDHEDFRLLVAWQVDQISNAHCDRHFANCEDALLALRDGTGPDVLLCDIGLPGMDGISGIQKIKALSPDTHVIILTVHDDHRKVFAGLCAGASGYLLKNASEEHLADAIEDVLHGGAPMTPRVARLVLDAFKEQNSGRLPPDYGLTPREKAILELMVKGLIKKEIAGELGVSYHTINNQLRRIYEKLHVNTRGSAVAKVLRERLF